MHPLVVQTFVGPVQVADVSPVAVRFPVVASTVIFLGARNLRTLLEEAVDA